MDFRNKITISLILLVSPFVSLADGNTDYGTVTRVYPVSDGTFYVKMSFPNQNNPTGCSNKEWFWNDGIEPGANRVYSALLTALASNKPVQLYYKDGAKCDQWGYSWVNSAKIKNE